jgi:hypothetical protein
MARRDVASAAFLEIRPRRQRHDVRVLRVIGMTTGAAPSLRSVRIPVQPEAFK